MPILKQNVIDRFEKEGKMFILLEDQDNGKLSIKHNTLGAEPEPFWEQGDIEIPIQHKTDWLKLYQSKPQKIEKKLKKLKL